MTQRGWSEYRFEKSAGHIAYLGDYEYFIVRVNGSPLMYSALTCNPVGLDGVRQGARFECHGDHAKNRMTFLIESYKKYYRIDDGSRVTVTRRSAARYGLSGTIVEGNFDHEQGDFFYVIDFGFRAFEPDPNSDRGIYWGHEISPA